MQRRGQALRRKRQMNIEHIIQTIRDIVQRNYHYDDEASKLRYQVEMLETKLREIAKLLEKQ